MYCMYTSIKYFKRNISGANVLFHYKFFILCPERRSKFTTTQLPIWQYIPMKRLKIACQKHKIESVIAILVHDKLHETVSFILAHFTEKIM